MPTESGRASQVGKPFAGFKDFADCVAQQEAKGKSRGAALRICGALMRGLEKPTSKAVWTRAFINTLPDSAFLYIASGGGKDGSGKTFPRSLRYFPYRDKSGKIDVPHLRNAIARIPQSNAPGLSADKKSSLQARARRLLSRMAKFTLSWQDFGDGSVVRTAASKQVCHLFIERPFGLEVFQLSSDPTGDAFEKISALRREFQTETASELLEYEGDASPLKKVGGVVLNPDGGPPSSLSILASGEVELVEDEEAVKRLRFEGEGFEGLFTLTKDESQDSDVWFFEPAGEVAEATVKGEEPSTSEPAVELCCPDCGVCRSFAEFGKREVRIVRGSTTTKIVKLAGGEATEEHYVLGVVLEPDIVDAQSDTYSEEEVRLTAHKFMEFYRHMGVMHREGADTAIRILESYLAPVDFEIDGEKVKKGTWLLAARITSPDLWQKVKSGEFTGWSIGGHAIREPLTD